MKNYFLLCLIVVGIFFEAAPLHNSISLWDDGTYVNLAQQVAKGEHITTNSYSEEIFANRLGVYIVPAVAIKLFGWSENITWIFTALFALMLAGIYFCLVRYDSWIAFAVTLLLATSPILVQESSIVMGDVPGALMASVPLLVYFCFFVNDSKKESSWVWGIFAGMVFISSSLFRESFVLVIPAMVWACITRKDGRRFWITTLVTVIAAGIVITGWNTIHGDFFGGLEAVRQGDDNGYAMASWWEKFKRETYQPFQFMIENFSYGALLLFAGLNFFGPKTKYVIILRWYLLITLFVFWVCPETITYLNPIPLLPRYWIPLLVPLALNGAFGLSRITKISGKEKIGIRWYILLFIAASMLVLYISRNEHLNRGLYEFSTMLVWAYLFLAAALYVVIWMNIPNKRTILVLSIAGFQVIALVAGELVGPSGQKVAEYRAEKNTLAKLVHGLHENDRVLTDHALVHNLGIYENIPKKYFLDFDTTNIATATASKGTVYLFLNHYRIERFTKHINVTEIYTIGVYPKLPLYVERRNDFFTSIDSTNTYQLMVLMTKTLEPRFKYNQHNKQL